MTSRRAILLFVLLVCIGALVVIGLRHSGVQHRIAVAAVNTTVDAHAAAISRLLAKMSQDDAKTVEDAIFQELQTTPTTTLLSRQDVTVEDAPGSSVRHCTIHSAAGGIQRVLASENQ